MLFVIVVENAESLPSAVASSAKVFNASGAAPTRALAALSAMVRTRSSVGNGCHVPALATLGFPPWNANIPA